MHRPSIRASLAILAIVAFTTMPAASAQSSSQGLKAAIIYNILRFVVFPAGNRDRMLNICEKRGTDSLSSLWGRSVGSRTINVKAVDIERGGADCDVFYLGNTNTAEITKIQQRGLLTIGDGSGFLKSGGTVGLITTGKQIRFEVNVRSARQSGIAISSQLLRLASRVEQ
ncbi:MAG: YfiR family protein [Sphingorhabdus sp.]